MQRKFIINLILLLFLNMLIKPFWVLGIDRTVQNVVGAADYGLYFALFNFSFLFNILLDIGITNFNNRNIARHDYLVTKHFSSIFSLKMVLGFVYLVITILVALIIGYQSEHFFMLLVLAFNQFLISLIFYIRSNLAGLHLFKTDSIVSVLDRTLMIIICSVLLWGNITSHPFCIEWLIYSQTIAYALTAFIAFVLVFFQTKTFRIQWNFPFSVMILKKSFPFAVLILLMTFYNRIDSVMIERMLPDGAVQAGIYAQAYRLLDATNMIAFLFAGLLLPLFSRMLKQKESAEPLVNLSSRLLIAFAMIVAVVSIVYRKEIMLMLYHEHTALSAPVFGYLMVCFVAISTTYIFGTLLTANGNLKELNIMASCGMILNIILNLILIPRYFALGAAIASLVTQSVTALAQVIIVQHKFRFAVNYKLILSLISFLLLISLTGYISKGCFMNWKLNVILLLSVSLVLSFVLHLIRIKSVLKFLMK